MKGSAWPWLVVGGLGVIAGAAVALRLRAPRLVTPGPIEPCDPEHPDWRDTGQRLEPGRVYRFRIAAVIPLPRNGDLSAECIEAPRGWYVAVQRGGWFDPWGWYSVGAGELGISGLPPWQTTRALVFRSGDPADRVQATSLRRGFLELS